MTAMSTFFTRNKANMGTRVNLVLPMGEATDLWVLVQGEDSDAYIKAHTRLQRLAIDLGMAKPEDKVRKEAELETARQNLVANCVAEWNLEDECTFENVCILLLEAPQIKTLVENAVYDRKRFFVENSVG